MSDTCKAAVESMLAFFAALDQRDHEAAAALVASDGTWHRQGQALTGPEAVRHALDARPANRSTCHIVTNMRSRLDESGQAHLAYYLTAFDAIDEGGETPPEPRLAGVLECTDVLVLRDGAWRILNKSSRRLMPPARKTTAA